MATGPFSSIASRLTRRPFSLGKTIAERLHKAKQPALVFVGLQLFLKKKFDASKWSERSSLEPGHAFYPAEGYHQDFLARNPTYPYIAINDLPKIANLKRLFPEFYRADPVLVSDVKATQ